jgi:PilZ domain
MDHRSVTRARAFLKAQIRFNNGMSTMDCLIRDLSEGGARLQISDSVALPSSFELYIPKRDETRRAILHWRNSEEIGVGFQGSSLSGSETHGLLQRVAQLESDTANLRRLVEAMQRDIGISSRRCDASSVNTGVHA